MILFIYVLLLSAGTNYCLNESRSNGSSTTGDEKTGSPLGKMDEYQRRIFVIVVGVMSTVFICTSFCCLQYNCLNKDVPKEQPVKEDEAAKSSRSSKTSISKHKKAKERIPEKQPMLSGIDTLSEPSSAEEAYISYRSEKYFKPSSTEKFIKPPSPKRMSRSSHLGKSYRKHSLDKSHKLAYAHKLCSQDRSSYPNRAVRPTSPDRLQYPLESTKLRHPTCSQNQILLPKSSSLKKFTKSPRHHDLKTSAIADREDILPTSPLIKSCPDYKAKYLACRTPESLINNISEFKKTNAQKPPFQRKVRPLSKFFNKVYSRDNAFSGSVRNGDDESETEITIFCNINLNEVIVKKHPE